MELSRAYIFNGQIIGPGEVDMSQFEDEDGDNPVQDALRKREDKAHEHDEVRSVVDQTQTSRLHPHQISRLRNPTEETITPAEKNDTPRRPAPASGVSVRPAVSHRPAVSAGTTD